MDPSRIHHGCDPCSSAQGETASGASAPQLCKECKDLRLPLPDEFQSHVGGYEKVASRATRCAFCKMICDGLRRYFAASSTSIDIEDVASIDQAIIGSIVYGNRWAIGIPGSVAIRNREAFGQCVVEVWVSPKAMCYLPFSQQRNNPIFHSLNNLRIDKDAEIEMHSQMQLYQARELIQKETRYREDKPTKMLPTRVIDVDSHTFGKQSGSHSAAPVLLAEPKPDTPGVYLALSHRWGSTRHITTERSNLAEHKRQIDLKNLPQTFLDAVELTRFLGIKYLWIDSLCIIQDDAADWEKESKRMGDVYHNALFTIAAHSASDDSRGFLKTTLRKVPLQGKDGQQFDVSLLNQFSEDVAFNSAISRRGWVLQERILSKYILHFLPSVIYFETALRTVVEIGSGSHHRVEQTPQLITDWTEWTSTKGQVTWHRIVEWYSQCALTQEKDKIPALAGIAAKIQSTSNGDYLAGMWANTFLMDLLWVSVDGKKSKRPTRSRASTWSWASLDGAVVFLSSTEAMHGGFGSHFSGMGGGMSNLEGPDIGPLLRERGGPWSPLWVDGPKPLLFRGFPERLPPLGDSYEGSWSEDGDRVGQTILHEFEQLVTVRFRPILLDGDVVGRVILDVDDGETSVQSELWFFLISSVGRQTHQVLVVSRGQNGNQYERVGIGIFVTSIVKEDESWYLVSKKLPGLGPDGKWSEIVLV